MLLGIGSTRASRRWSDLWIPPALRVRRVPRDRGRDRATALSVGARRADERRARAGRRRACGRVDPRFRPTGEVFIDPTSGQRMRVVVDPSSGERRYVAEGCSRLAPVDQGGAGSGVSAVITDRLLRLRAAGAAGRHARRRRLLRRRECQECERAHPRPWLEPEAHGSRPTLARDARARRVPHLSRELSWIEFNARVLHEASDERNPAARADEVPGDLRLQPRRVLPGPDLDPAACGSRSRVAPLDDGPSPTEQLAQARRQITELVTEQSATYKKLRRLLASEGIEIVDYAKVPEHHAALRERFLAEIYPVLTPLAVDPGHPFPYITSLTLSVAVALRDPVTDERRFARVKVPPVLPRLVELPRAEGQPIGEHRYTLLDQVIGANLDILFIGHGDPPPPPLPRDAGRRPGPRRGRRRRPRRRDRGGAPTAPLRRAGPARGRALDAGGAPRGAARAAWASPRTRRSRSAGCSTTRASGSSSDLDRPDLKWTPWTPVIPARLAPAGRGRAGRHVRRDPGGRPAPPPPLRELHGERRAPDRAGRRRSGRPRRSSRRSIAPRSTRASSTT